MVNLVPIVEESGDVSVEVLSRDTSTTPDAHGNEIAAREQLVHGRPADAEHCCGFDDCEEQRFWWGSWLDRLHTFSKPFRAADPDIGGRIRSQLDADGVVDCEFFRFAAA